MRRTNAVDEGSNDKRQQQRDDKVFVVVVSRQPLRVVFVAAFGERDLATRIDIFIFHITTI